MTEQEPNSSPPNIEAGYEFLTGHLANVAFARDNLLSFHMEHEALQTSLGGLQTVRVTALEFAQDIAVDAIRREKLSRAAAARILGVHQVTVAKWVDLDRPRRDWAEEANREEDLRQKLIRLPRHEH